LRGAEYPRPPPARMHAKGYSLLAEIMHPMHSSVYDDDDGDDGDGRSN
jgi:hypothetical protein